VLTELILCDVAHSCAVVWELREKFIKPLVSVNKLSWMCLQN